MMSQRFRNQHGRTTVVITSLVVLAGAAVIGAAFTKPTENQFRGWYRQQLVADVNLKGNNPADVLKSGLSGLLKGVQAEFTTQYEDHVVYSTVTVDEQTKRVRYLGIFGSWHRLGEAR